MTSDHPRHSAAHHASKFTNRQRTIALIIVALAFIMDLLDSTIVNIAIPSIQTNLGAGFAAIQWMIAGYSLAFAVLLIIGGRMGDVFGYKRLFLVGVAGFTLTSLACGMAPNAEVLVAARILQGAMAALMVPQVMSMMQIMYKPHERTKVMGLFGAMAGIAASLGPVVGGVLIHFNIAGLDWRPIFLINIPVGIIALILGQRYLPDCKSSHPLRLDILGTILIIVTLSLLVFPLIQGRELDWPMWIFIMMFASLPLLALFVWWQVVKQKRDKSALVIPGLFKKRSFSTGLLVNLIFQAAMVGSFFPQTLLLQIGLGFEVVLAAVAGIPISIGIASSIGFFGQKLIPKLGRYAMTLGTVVMAIGLGTTYLIVNHFQLETTGWHFIPGFLITGLGMGLVMAPVFAVVLTDVNPRDAGSASGVLNAIQQLGAAIGVALVGVILFGQLASNADHSFASIESNIKRDLTALHLPAEAQEQIVSGVRTCYDDRAHQKDSSHTPDSCKQLEASNTSQPANPVSDKIADSIATNIKKANAANFIHSYGMSVLFSYCLLATVFVLSFLLPRHIRPEATGQGH